MKDKNIVKDNEFEDFVLEHYEESWILGFPLKTRYGYIKPLKVKDYWRYNSEIDFLKKQPWEIKNIVLKELKGTDIYESIKHDFVEHGFMTCLRNNVGGLRKVYDKIFSKLIHNFNSKMYWAMKESEFNELRKLILDFNHITYHEKNPNPEIEKFNRMKMLIMSNKGGIIEFDTVYSVLMTKEGGGFLPEQINNLTIRQFYLAFKRAELVKANEATTLFKTIDAKDKIEVVDWNKSFREKEDDNTYESTSELKKNIFLKQ